MTPLRVLHTVRGLGINGITNAVARTVARLDPARVRSEVCSIYDTDALAADLRTVGVDPVFIGYRNAASAPRTIARLVRLIRDRRIDVVHTNQTVDLMLAGVAARLCGVPVVASIHWLAEPVTERRRRIFDRAGLTRRRLRRVAERRLVARLVAVSETARTSHLREFGDAFAADRVVVIYPGIEPDPPPLPPGAAERVREELGLDGAGPVLLNVGRLDRAKGQRYLIPMMEIVRRRFPEARLLIAGDGELRPSLEHAIAAAGQTGTTRLLGWRLDVDALLAAADLLVLASVSESVGLPLLEAMRAGKPVVGTRVGGVPELVDDGISGRIAAPADPAALAEAVIAVLETPGLAQRMGEAGRRVVRERFDVAASARALEELYRAVAASTSLDTPGSRGAVPL